MCESKSDKEILEKWNELEKKIIPKISTDEMEKDAMIKYLLIKMTSLADEDGVNETMIEKTLNNVIQTRKFDFYLFSI